jgi:hypothetical protein
MRRRTVMIAVVLFLSCATTQPLPRPPPTEGTSRSYRSLQGKAVTVLLVDGERHFADQPETLSTAREALRVELTSHGVAVEDDAPLRWTLEVHEGKPSLPGSTVQCVRVDARLEHASSAFRPGSSSTTTRCGGQGSTWTGEGGRGADPLTALVSLGAAAVNAANGTSARERAAGLFEALDALLGQLDAQTQYGSP